MPELRILFHRALRGSDVLHWMTCSCLSSSSAFVWTASVVSVRNTSQCCGGIRKQPSCCLIIVLKTFMSVCVTMRWSEGGRGIGSVWMFTATRVNKCPCPWPCLRKGTHSVLADHADWNSWEFECEKIRFLFPPMHVHGPGWKWGGRTALWISGLVSSHASSVWLHAADGGDDIVTLSHAWCRLI